MPATSSCAEAACRRQVLLIASGSVRVTSDDDPEPELLVAGGVVGLRPVLQGVTHTEEAVVATGADVLGIRTDVLDLVLALPAVGRVLGRGEIRRASD